MRGRQVRVLLAALAVTSATVAAQAPPASSCDQCAVWNAPQEPFQIFANVYYVGPRGLSAILITSDEGHVLLDAGLPESAPAIAASIGALGFRIEDVELILNSHAHFDHAGGIAELQRLSGASVAARRPSVRVLETGRSGPDDPQFGVVPAMAPVPRVQIVEDRATLQLGPIRLTAYATGGHTPGGTSWAWRSCEARRCLDFVYADSLTAVAADSFRFTRSTTYPNALADFEAGFTTLGAIPCDVLLTPHPEASGLWARVAKRDEGAGVDALVDRGACRRYAEAAQGRLRTRLEQEKTRR